MLSLDKTADLATARPAWNRLHPLSSGACVFNSFDWQSAWWRSFGDGAELLLWLLRDGDRVVGIAPLMRHDDCVCFIGGKAVSDYLDFLAAPGYEAALIEATVRGLDSEPWETVVLRGLRRDSPFLGLLRQLVENAGWATRLDTEDVSPVVHLPTTWDAYLASLSKKDRHELRRKLRRLDASASWTWYARTAQEVEPRDIEDFIALMRSSREEKALFLDHRVEQFFRSVIKHFTGTGVARLYFLEVDSRRVASTLCFDVGTELWLYNSGFDPDFSHLSVGLLLKALCLRDAIGLGKRKFDFLRGSEPYKYHLGAADEPVYALQGGRTGQGLNRWPRFKDEH